jgi:hypothetical protein
MLLISWSEIKDLEAGIVGVAFNTEEDLNKLDWDASYCVLESTCFFGAVEPVLKSLKSMDLTSMIYGCLILM